jgi:hypothetical protein
MHSLMRDVKFGAGPRSNNWEAAGLRVPRFACPHSTCIRRRGMHQSPGRSLVTLGLRRSSLKFRRWLFCSCWLTCSASIPLDQFPRARIHRGSKVLSLSFFFSLTKIFKKVSVFVSLFPAEGVAFPSIVILRRKSGPSEIRDGVIPTSLSFLKASHWSLSRT